MDGDAVERVTQLEAELQRERLAHIATVLACVGQLAAFRRNILGAFQRFIAGMTDDDGACVDHFHVHCSACGGAGIVDHKPDPGDTLLCPNCLDRAVPPHVPMGKA